MKTISILFSENRDIFVLIIKKWQERLAAGLYWSDDNIKIFNNCNSSKFTSSFFFFCASKCLFRFFIYLTPIYLNCNTVLIYFPFLHRRSLLFNERIWYWITFFQLESRCSNCNHFCQPYKTERCKVQEPSCLIPSNWCSQSLSF